MRTNCSFKPEPKQMSKKSRVWDIKKTKSSLGPSVCTNILFVYFFLDVTRPPGSMALKKLTIDAYLFFQQAEAFNRSAATEEEIVLAGEKALLCVYIANRLLKALIHCDALDFVSKLRQLGTTFVQPESLPPTSAAAAYHSQRAYFQIQRWKGIPLKPKDWG